MMIGIVKIKTIYPGWYTGRAVHIHLNVFIPKTVFANGTYGIDARKLYTGQLYFNVPLTVVILILGYTHQGYGKF